MQRISHWVNNKVVAGTSGNVGKVYNPATGEVQAEVDLASVAEVDAVVAAAKEAFVTWRATNLSRRAEIMFRMRELVDANRKELANIVSLEHGKVPSDAMGVSPIFTSVGLISNSPTPMHNSISTHCSVSLTK